MIRHRDSKKKKKRRGGHDVILQEIVDLQLEKFVR
jgi:hypothetical protein